MFKYTINLEVDDEDVSEVNKHLFSLGHLGKCKWTMSGGQDDN